MTISTVQRLPPTFRSLYRLFLRTLSASVLHHPARKNLRKSWRPTFDSAAHAIHKLQCDSFVDVAEKEEVETLLKSWELRIDNTLSLLYNSAHSRGLPHALTRNLSLLRRANIKWTNDLYRKDGRFPWNPHLPPSSPAYQPPDERTARKTEKRQEKKKELRHLHERAFSAVEEVMKLAEGRHKMFLGRVSINKQSR